MVAFEQGPESADAPPKEVPSLTAEGMSFMQTSELAHVDQQQAGHADQQHSEETYVKEGEAQDGPGVGMTKAPGSADEPENAAAPSLAQLDAQTVSRIASGGGKAADHPIRKLSGQQPGSFNWADAEDSHHVPETFDMPSGTEAPLASAPAPAALEDSSSAPTGLAPPIATDVTDNVQSAQTPREGGRGRGGRGGPRGNFRGGPRGGFRRYGGGAPNGNPANGPQPPQNRDDDGFQVAGRRRPGPSGGPGQGQGQGQGGPHRGRGRGSFGGVGGSGEGGRGGRGSFRGRGARKCAGFLELFFDPLTFGHNSSSAQCRAATSNQLGTSA